MTSGGNHRVIVGSIKGSMPCFCAIAMRSSHCCALAGLDWQPEVAHNHPVEPLGMLLGQAECSRSSHGEAGKMRLRDRKRSHQPERIGDQGFEAVAARRRIGGTVATLIITQDAERGFEFACLLFPGVEIGCERIAPNEPGCPLRAVDAAIDGDAVGVDLHCTSFRRYPGGLRERPDRSTDRRFAC